MQQLNHNLLTIFDHMLWPYTMILYLFITNARLCITCWNFDIVFWCFVFVYQSFFIIMIITFKVDTYLLYYVTFKNKCLLFFFIVGWNCYAMNIEICFKIYNIFVLFREKRCLFKHIEKNHVVYIIKKKIIIYRF